ncbi:unnamed protein product [Linum tenue]|uniref:Uncharacterized protein n=1 Tax=Linum tenue TaxID=586396 RepID=A0AAV0QJE8_9ROSI|nr:unnamed protein product [Linum tenue]
MTMQTHIVYMGSLLSPENSFNHLMAAANNRHHNLLSSVLGDEELARSVRVSSFGRSFDGFSARLLPEEAERLKEHPNVVSVFPNQIRKLHTTRSWDLIGVTQSVRRNLKFELDIIVGVLDTGINVNAPSFNDKGLGPPPAKWKGICQKGANFTHCNNKVIGARAYAFDNDHGEPAGPSPCDLEGHGSHTASTVAGSLVQGASLYGLMKGTARGGVPSARIAMYKVCGKYCTDLNILHGFDDAIADGVDVISLSAGGGPFAGYFTDAISIGAFHAMRKGVLTSVAAGNSGPDPNTVSNVAPWLMTVGASGTDRQLVTPITIGRDGFKTLGNSINTVSAGKKFLPLVSGRKAQNSSSNDAKTFPGACIDGSTSIEMVKGKVVLCNGAIEGDSVLKRDGALGMLMADYKGELDAAYAFVLPTAMITPERYLAIERYINSTKNPQVLIHKSRSIHVDSPFVASFSSRGPDRYSKTILKPDLVAPGVNILAAYTNLASITSSPLDNRFSNFNIMSGTSMACPHAAAAAAYIKSFHPDWSPAAVKSALMTTAEYAYGSGQIDPTRAVDPGLVYDLTEADYVGFLCSMGYNSVMMKPIVGRDDVACPLTKAKVWSGSDALNYPSMNLQLPIPGTGGPVAAVFRRTVTNVGAANATYKAEVGGDVAGWSIKVVPETLVFGEVNERKSFRVMVRGPPVNIDDGVLSASVVWRDTEGRWSVRSPIVISADLLT